jgi:hypothetical protein
MLVRKNILLFAIAACSLAAVSTVSASTIKVTNTNDSGPNSLRAAIAAAQSGDIIKFRLTYPATITLTSGQLVINTNLTIAGPGASKLAISGNNAQQILYVSSSIIVTISGVTLENGAWQGGDVYNNGGGAIENHGTLTLNKSVVSNNSGAFGGGINTWGALTVNESTISGNGACCGLAAGGIANFGALTVTRSTFTGNSGYYDGGGILNGGTATVTQSTFSGNYGYGAGAGIMNAGTLAVLNSTFSGNSNCGPYNPGSGYGNYGIGAGISNGGGAYGGAGGTVDVTNSTFSGNCAYAGAALLPFSGTLTLKNSILANSVPAGNSPYASNCYNPNGATLTSDGFDLSDDNTCSSFLTGIGDLNSTPAGLDPNGLQNNGGFTQTIALISGSAAIDAIPLKPVNYCTDAAGNPVKVDQRGVHRPQNKKCDIGAFELKP